MLSLYMYIYVITVDRYSFSMYQHIACIFAHLSIYLVPSVFTRSFAYKDIYSFYKIVNILKKVKWMK